MAALSELDVVNEMLGGLGEAPLNTLDEEHPLVPAARRTLRLAAAELQAQRWWFNSEFVTLAPDPSTGDVITPGDAISVDPVDPYDHLVQRGRRLYDPTNETYNIARSIRCKLVREIPYEDLPRIAQNLISTQAQFNFNKAYDGDRQKLSLLSDELARATAVLRAEHVSAMDVNLLETRSHLQKLNFIRGGTRRYY